jgi:hypothetical protein
MLSTGFYQSLYSWCVFLLNCTKTFLSCVLLPFTKASCPMCYVFICCFRAYNNTFSCPCAHCLLLLACCFVASNSRARGHLSGLHAYARSECKVCCLLPNIDFMSAEYLSVCYPDDRLFVVSAFVQFSFLFRIEYIHFPSSTVQQDVNLNRDYMSMRFVSPPARISLFNTNIVFDFRLYMRFQDSTMPVKVFCA